MSVIVKQYEKADRLLRTEESWRITGLLAFWEQLIAEKVEPALSF